MRSDLVICGHFNRSFLLTYLRVVSYRLCVCVFFRRREPLPLRRSYTLDLPTSTDCIVATGSEDAGNLHRELQRSWTYDCVNRQQLATPQPEVDYSHVRSGFEDASPNSSDSGKVETWMNSCAFESPFTGPPLELQVG